MKPPTFAPAYVGLFPVLAEIAQEMGYALAVHGSVSRDFDLLAAPWTETAGDPQDLVDAIAERLNLVHGPTSWNLAEDLHKPERKPHGRLAWSITIDCGAVIDISVMPRTA